MSWPRTRFRPCRALYGCVAVNPESAIAVLGRPHQYTVRMNSFQVSLFASEQENEDVSTGSKAQAPPSFAPKDLQNITEQNSHLQAGNAFLQNEKFFGLASIATPSAVDGVSIITNEDF